MAATKSRQRELARAKYRRQLIRRAAAERRRRQLQAGIGAGLAVILIVVGAVWLLGGFDRSTQPAAADTCTWSPVRGAPGAGIKDVGTPPTKDIPTSGTRQMTITFNTGVVTAELDLANAPCTSASFAYLASRNFFDNTICHRLMNKTDYVLQCGDPSGSGSGGPAYSFADENLPDPSIPIPAAPGPSASASPGPSASPTAIYPAGTLAMANSGTPGTNGSQFFIVYKDSPFPPNYTIFGKIISGLDVIVKIAEAGHDGAYEPNPGGGKPKNEVRILSLTVGEVRAPGAPAPSGGPTPTPSTQPATAPTPSPKPSN